MIAAPFQRLYLIVDGQRLDLGLVNVVRAEVFGEPGQRTFRILIQTAEGRVSLWLEKQQLVMLGSALEELLDRIPADGPELMDLGPHGTFVGELEVKVASLAIGYDQQSHLFRLEAGDFESVFALAAISLSARREQFVEMKAQIEEIAMGSRPRCPLCGTPLTGQPHFCPESNGHARVSRPN